MKLITLLLILIQVFGCSHKQEVVEKKDITSVSYDPLIINCEKGNADSCIEVGLKKDDALIAADFFKKACELKSEVGCGIIIFYLDPKSHSSKDLFARSCYIKKNKIGCHFLGLLYLKQKQWVLAKGLLKKSCEMGFVNSCSELLRQAISNKDKKDVISFTEKTCLLGKHGICFLLAQYNYSIGNIKKALKFTKFSCESKNSESCYFAGLLEQASGSLNKSLSFFKQSCVLKNAKGCYYLGKTSLLVDKQTQGIHYLSVSCDLNFSQACLELANHYQEKNLKNDAIIFFVKSCRKTEVNSYERVFNCLMSAQYMSQFFDRKSSLEFFRMACKSDVPKKQNTLDLQNDACTRLALYSNDNSLLGKGIKYSKLRCEKGKSKKDRAYNCYSLACVYSLKNDFNNSLIYLEKAIQEKVFKRKSLEEDFELTNIKNHSEFKELLNSYY